MLPAQLLLDRFRQVEQRYQEAKQAFVSLEAAHQAGDYYGEEVGEFLAAAQALYRAADDFRSEVGVSRGLPRRVKRDG